MRACFKAFKARVFDQSQPVLFSHELILFQVPSSHLRSLLSVCGMASSFYLCSISENSTVATGAALQIHLLLLCVFVFLSIDVCPFIQLLLSPLDQCTFNTLIPLHLSAAICHRTNPCFCMFLSGHDCLLPAE